MQIARHELNGNLVEVVEFNGDAKDCVNHAQSLSLEENGYLCIAGDRLDAEDDTQKILIGVCISGQVVIQNAWE